MKKTIFTLLSFCILLNSNSQEIKKKNGEAFKPNWYIGANGGTNLYMAEGNKFYQSAVPFAFSMSDNSGFIGRGELGYDLTPFFGIRGLLGNAQHYWPDIRFKNPNGTYKVSSFGSESLTADLMFNLSNGFAGYNSNRLFNLSVFAGGGVAHRDKASFTNDFYTGILRGGIQGSFRLSSQFDLDVIADGNAVADNFNNYNITTPFELYTTLTVGLTYHFRGKSKKSIPDTTEKLETKTVIIHDTIRQTIEKSVEPVDEPVIATKRNGKNLSAKKQMAKVSVDHSKATGKSVKGNSGNGHSKSINHKPELVINIFYPLNETHIDQEKQEQAITKVVEYMKMYPNARIVVRGYGDRDNGTHAVNYVISSNRAENVTSILTKTYDIHSNRIKTRGVGSSYQPFKQGNMNRLVVVSSEL